MCRRSKKSLTRHDGRMRAAVFACRRLALLHGRYCHYPPSTTRLHYRCSPFLSLSAMSSTNASATPEKNVAAPKEEDTAAATTTSTQPATTDNNDSNQTKNKKRKQPWFNKKERNKKARAEKQDQKTGNRRGLDHDWESQTPHLGSFANPELQKQFHVQVPTFDDTTTKIPKRKVAILLAYTGTNYGGFQINANQRTLHSEIELALYKARFLSKDNFGFPHKYSWSSSARTDKGVHACAQVVSCKLSVGDDMDAAREEVNGFLPADIRVLDIVKTSKSFCAKTQRDRARYTYMVPSFLLYVRTELQDLFKRVLGGPNPREGRSARHPLSQEEISQLSTELYKFRATPQHVQDLQDTLSQYEGTKSFHNFTNKKTAQDADAQRYIISFQTQEPIMMEGIEWIPTQVVGQSFLLHQIRKMVSLAIDVARGSASMTVMDHALSKACINLNLAPAQGLFLDMSIFEGYNRHKKNAHVQHLDWVTDPTTPAVQRWSNFREGVIMKHIGQEEASQGNFVRYLYVQEYVYDCKRQYNAVDDQNKK